MKKKKITKKSPKLDLTPRAPLTAKVATVKLAEAGILGRSGRSKYRDIFAAAGKAPIGEGAPVPLEGDTSRVVKQRVAVALGRFAGRTTADYVLRAVRSNDAVYIGKFAVPAAKAPKKAKKK